MDSTKFYKQLQGKISQKYLDERIRTAKRLYLIINEHIKSSKLNVLDVGSGVGISTLILADYFPQSKFIGIEPGKRLIKKSLELKKKYKAKHVRFIEGDATKMKFKENNFNLVICEQVIEHVKESDKLVSEISRVLKEGGILFISAPNKAFVRDTHFKRPFVHWLPKNIAKHLVAKRLKEYVSHTYPISTIKLERMLLQNGLKPIYIGGRFFDKDVIELMYGKSLLGHLFHYSRWFAKSSIGGYFVKLFFPYNGFVAIKK